jgi:biopolymer transport protein TolQ
MASIWSWSIIIEKTRKFFSLKRKAQLFEDAFWSGESLEKTYIKRKKKALYILYL